MALQAALSRAVQQCSPQLTCFLLGAIGQAEARHAIHTAADATSQVVKKKGQLVFLGTPSFSADVLRMLLEASQQPDSCFEVAAVVSRHPSASSSSNSPSAGQQQRAAPTSVSLASSSSEKQAIRTYTASPVETVAREWGMARDRVLCPPHAKEPAFLSWLEDLGPDVCLTAAYGCMLPQRFLDVPSHGTVNIHPSLLPKYRGAAPVQRALQDGLAETGVSVAYTVLRCDAGPVLAQQRVQVGEEEQAPELTQRLFRLGGQLLLSHMPGVITGQAQKLAIPQDESLATHAPKLTKDDAALDLAQPAHVVHNRVRAMAGWPGSRAGFVLEDRSTGELSSVELKVLRTRVVGPGEYPSLGQNKPAPQGAGGAPDIGRLESSRRVVLWDRRMLVPCRAGTWLELEEVRLSSGGRKGSPGRSLSGQDFMAGLGLGPSGKRWLYVVDASGSPPSNC